MTTSAGGGIMMPPPPPPHPRDDDDVARIVPRPRPPRRALLLSSPDASASASASASPPTPPVITASVSTLADLRLHVARDSPTTRVELAANVDLSLDALGELPPVEKALVITGAACASDPALGANCAVSAGSLSRHFTVGATGALTLEDLTLRLGAATGLPWGDGGSVFAYGHLTAIRVAFEANAATLDGVGRGGAVALLDASARFEDCLFLANAASGDGGAVFVSSGDATFSRCSFERNDAKGLGAGVAVDRGVAVVRACVFAADNTAREANARDVHVAAPGGVELEPFEVWDEEKDSAEDATKYRVAGLGSVERASAVEGAPEAPGGRKTIFPKRTRRSMMIPKRTRRSIPTRETLPTRATTLPPPRRRRRRRVRGRVRGARGDVRVGVRRGAAPSRPAVDGVRGGGEGARGRGRSRGAGEAPSGGGALGRREPREGARGEAQGRGQGEGPRAERSAAEEEPNARRRRRRRRRRGRRRDARSPVGDRGRFRRRRGVRRHRRDVGGGWSTTTAATAMAETDSETRTKTAGAAASAPGTDRRISGGPTEAPTTTRREVLDSGREARPGTRGTRTTATRSRGWGACARRAGRRRRTAEGSSSAKRPRRSSRTRSRWGERPRRPRPIELESGVLRARARRSVFRFRLPRERRKNGGRATPPPRRRRMGRRRRRRRRRPRERRSGPRSRSGPRTRARDRTRARRGSTRGARARATEAAPRGGATGGHFHLRR